MGTATSTTFSEAPGSEPRTLAALLLESIALRHQIAVLERSRTRRPCFHLWDRLFWILFSRWWPQWRNSLIIVQPRDSLALAPRRLVSALAISSTGSLARWAPEG